MVALGAEACSSPCSETPKLGNTGGVCGDIRMNAATHEWQKLVQGMGIFMCGLFTRLIAVRAADRRERGECCMVGGHEFYGGVVLC